MYELPMECKPGREVPGSGGSGGHPQALEVVTEKQHIVRHDRRDEDKSREIEIEKQRVREVNKGTSGDLENMRQEGFVHVSGELRVLGSRQGIWKWEGVVVLSWEGTGTVRQGIFFVLHRSQGAGSSSSSSSSSLPSLPSSGFSLVV
ncbi:hypothetical protein F5876DRAFT_70056 [Lentinula aff. lateritia]|uniref:Uncharacterized protein n=1 Tax=Lentinula aff. lateritia TaxID=2804960 RepID=A0ACC1TK63_9AGAR|nr:hypothetical protein F5876DRAFT_70056 [Lentinula aff. lateritia]